MYGLHIDCLEKFMLEKYGVTQWSEILKEVEYLDLDVAKSVNFGSEEHSGRGGWIVNKKYSDDLFLKLLVMSASKTGMEVDELIENLGSHFIEYIR